MINKSDAGDMLRYCGVDEEKVETEKALDALVSFRINNAGDHSVELKYWPASYTAGIVISSMGLLIFAFLILYSKKKSHLAKQYKKDILWDENAPANEDISTEKNDDKNTDGGF